MAHPLWDVETGRATDARESAAVGADAALFEALASACRNFYGERLAALAVYGSYARGDQRPDSDVDLLVVADSYPPDISDRGREFAAVRAALPSGLARALSPVFFTPDEMRQGSLIFLDMTREVVILCDNGVLRAYLDDLRSRLEKMGSYRVGRGRDAYWIMAPPGVKARDIVI